MMSALALAFFWPSLITNWRVGSAKLLVHNILVGLGGGENPPYSQEHVLVTDKS